MKKFINIIILFLPIIAYSIWEWMIGNVEFVRVIDEIFKPYFFNTSLMIGIVIGLFQIVNEYKKTKEISLYVIQQIFLLLIYTLIPLYFGHFIHGYSIFGLIGLGVALVYFIDLLLGARLFIAFPYHFSPEIRTRLQDPKVKRTIIQLGYFFVLTWVLNNSFILFGNILFSKKTYLFLLPVFSKFIWIGFIGFCFWFPKWKKKRNQAKINLAPNEIS